MPLIFDPSIFDRFPFSIESGSRRGIVDDDLFTKKAGFDTESWNSCCFGRFGRQPEIIDIRFYSPRAVTDTSNTVFEHRSILPLSDIPRPCLLVLLFSAKPREATCILYLKRDVHRRPLFFPLESLPTSPILN